MSSDDDNPVWDDHATNESKLNKDQKEVAMSKAEETARVKLTEQFELDYTPLQVSARKERLPPT